MPRKSKKTIIDQIIKSVILKVEEDKKYSEAFLDAQWESIKKRNKHLDGKKINIIKLK